MLKFAYEGLSVLKTENTTKQTNKKDTDWDNILKILLKYICRKEDNVLIFPLSVKNIYSSKRIIASIPILGLSFEDLNVTLKRTVKLLSFCF